MARRADPVVDGSRSRPASTRGPKPILGEESRERICEAALRCFERNGIRRTTIENIAQEAGVSRPAVYHYFASREEIVLEVIVREAAAMIVEISRRVARRRGLDRVVQAAYLGAKASIENAYVKTITTGDSAPYTAQLLRHERFQQLEEAFYGPLLESAQAAGEVRTDRSIAEMIDWIVLHQFTVATHAQDLNLDDRALRNQFHVYLAASLRPQPEPSRHPAGARRRQAN